jgi:hypothetical protein
MERVMTYDDWFIEKDINDRYFLFDRYYDEIDEVELIKTVDITDIDDVTLLEKPNFDYTYSGEFDYAEKDGRFMFGYFKIIGLPDDFQEELEMIMKKFRKTNGFEPDEHLSKDDIDRLVAELKHDLNYYQGNITLAEYIGL